MISNFVNPPLFPRLPAARCREGAFALITTLLILSLLVIVAVSYLSSMAAERQTADAYDAKAVAEQAAQTGVDSATAMLAQCFRDFPDSATVWDPQQTQNTGAPYNSMTIVGGSYNEGTSLYLRAVPSSQDSSAYAVALPHGTLSAANGTPYPSNDPAGNDPSNLGCKTFVLPLISGVLNGQARLIGSKSSIFSSAMKLNVSDPTQQNWTDLNVRRISGDIQGVVGSPPNWTGVGPKPARAYWVNLTGSNNLVTGRYAFWIDDESFRLNTSLAGPSAAALAINPAAPPPQQPPDNTMQPLDPVTGKPRSLQPGDLMLLGTLSAAGDSGASSDTTNVMATRKAFPGGFFPDPLAFAHASLTTPVTDTLRYLTTNQSGALNISRHGSQRLNLNTAIFTPSATSVPPATTSAAVAAAIQKQVNELVETLEFHLPNFGERFYRTTSTALNDATQVPGSPYPLPSNTTPYATGTDGTPVTDGSNSQIYHYKVAANLRDYVDTDSQPTMIGSSPMGVVMAGAPTADLGDNSQTSAKANEIWAQGKESAPYIQEVAVRYRPTVTPNMNYQPYYTYSIYVDYYIEFWNMSDRDIYASQMNNPSVWVRDQQTWDTYYPKDSIMPDPNSEPLIKNIAPLDMQIGLVTGVTNADGSQASQGVLFRAGTVTVVTTDPQCASYTYKELTSSGGSGVSAGKTNHPSANVANLGNVYVCPVISGNRLYTGKIVPYNSAGTYASNVGIQMGEPFEGSSPYTSTTPFPGTEVSLVNTQGYFDVVRGAITKTGACGYHIYTKANNTDSSQGGYSDYSYGSSIMGNVQDTGGGPAQDNEVLTVSQIGDPRTNNEQLMINVNRLTSDGTRFMASTRTLGSPNYPDLAPDTTASDPTNGTTLGWPDYYKFPSATPANSQNPDATTAPMVIVGASTTDGPLTSVGQLGDVFDPARAQGADIRYSHGGGRTFKIGQHDDLYSDDATTNVPTTSGNYATSTADNVSASNGWASWRLTDIFSVADPIQLPGRININGIMRDNGAALLSTMQGFVFQPKTATTGTVDANIHGDGTSGLAAAALNTTGASNGFSQIVAQMKQRLDPTVVTNGRVKPFFERGEMGELGGNTSSPLFGISSTATNNTLVASVDMNKTADHSREELFRRLAEMLCTRGNTFTAYVVGQSIIQTAVNGPLKIAGTQRMRVTFRLVPKAKDPKTGTYMDFHPAYVINPNGSLSQNTFDPANPNETSSDLSQPEPIGVIPRFAKPERYDVQILQVMSY